MQIYSAKFLKQLHDFCKHHGIHLVADEIFTGFGRTGKMLACEWADIEPDFLCLSKGLTGGTLPMSAMLTTNEVYALFYGPYDDKIAFMHSNTHYGNALAAAAALAVFDVIETEHILTHSQHLGDLMRAHLDTIAKQTGRLKNIRQIGAVAAADLILEPERSNQRMGYRIYREAIAQGALLRPLGDTLYWVPPLNTPPAVLTDLKNITLNSIAKVLT